MERVETVTLRRAFQQHAVDSRVQSQLFFIFTRDSAGDLLLLSMGGFPDLVIVSDALYLSHCRSIQDGDVKIEQRIDEVSLTPKAVFFPPLFELDIAR